MTHNPYPPSVACVKESDDPGDMPGKPWPLWLVLSAELYAVLAAVLNYCLIYAGALPLDLYGLDYYYGSGAWWRNAQALVITGIQLYGVILLFRQRRQALLWLLGGLGLSWLALLARVSDPAWRAMVEQVNWGGSALGACVDAAIVWYALRLRAQGALH